MNFNDFEWHDAIIKNIKIDRSHPGINDSIIFEIESVDGVEMNFIFEEVYWASMILNFGIVAEECVLNAFKAERDDQDLSHFYSKWKGLMDNIKLDCYVINLNSTGGQIKIIAKSFLTKNL